MKNSIAKRAALLLLGATLVLPSVGCKSKDGGTSEAGCPVSLPDYSSTNLQFEITGQLSSGVVTANGEKIYVPEYDFCNEEDIRTFKEMGNTVAKISRGYYALGKDEDWETSKIKKFGDMLYAQGITKAYIADEAFLEWVHATPLLLDETNGKYKTEEELDAFVTERLKQYIDEPWFYGVDIVDEPKYNRKNNIAPLTASIRRCGKALGKDVRVYVNLHPSTAGTAQFGERGTYETAREAYENYIEGYVKDTNTNQMSVDHYPFLAEGNTRGYFATMQSLRNVCTKYDIEMQLFAHTFSDYTGGAMRYRDIDQSMMYYNFNSMVGFGTSTIHWYRYAPYLDYTHGANATNSAFAYDKGFLVDRKGNPTNLYYYAKEIVAEFQSFANVILNYEYQGGKLFQSDALSRFGINDLFTNFVDSGTMTANDWDNSHKLTLVKDLQMTNEATFLTELLDEKNELYMYMIMNPIDPYYNEFDTSQTITVDFGAEHEWAAEFDQGVLNYVKLEGGKYTKTLSAGYATYVVPLDKNGKQAFTAADASKDIFRDEWWK